MKRRTILPFAFVLAAYLVILPAAVVACPVPEYGDYTLLSLVDIPAFVAFTLTTLGIWATAVSIERLLTYRIVRKQSQEFALEAYKPWFSHRNLFLSAWDQKNPLAAVVAAVLQDAKEARAAGICPADSYEQARQRAVTLKQTEFRRRLWVLEAISWTAPMLGILGTAGGRADDEFFMAYALLVAGPTLFIRKYLASYVEALVAELNDASARLVHHFLNREHPAIPDAAPDEPDVVADKVMLPSFLSVQAD